MKLIWYSSLVIIFLSFSCSSSNEKSDSDKEKQSELSKSRNTTEKKNYESDGMGETENDSAEIISKYEFKGYVGTYAISLTLNVQSDDQISGEYYYNNVGKPIKLNGKMVSCEDCGGEGTPCKHLELQEIAPDKTISTWHFECFDYILYDYPSQTHWPMTGLWEGDTSSYRIALVTKITEKYLEPNSHLLFDSKEASINFFKEHEIHNNEVYDKSFYLMPKNVESLYDSPLPIGFEIGIYYGMEASYAKLNDDLTFVGDVDDFSVYDLPLVKLSSEKMVVKLNELNTFRVSDNSYSVALDELQKHNYYLMDEHTWLLRSSGNVLGYFPVAETIPFYERPSLGSRIIFKEASEENGQIKILEIKTHNAEYWAKVRFDYYTNVPCSDEVRDEKPSVEGWIRLYDDQDNLSLRYYSGGC